MKDFLLACALGVMFAVGVAAGTVTGEPIVMTGPALWWVA